MATEAQPTILHLPENTGVWDSLFGEFERHLKRWGRVLRRRRASEAAAGWRRLWPQTLTLTTVGHAIGQLTGRWGGVGAVVSDSNAGLAFGLSISPPPWMTQAEPPCPGPPS